MFPECANCSFIVDLDLLSQMLAYVIAMFQQPFSVVFGVEMLFLAVSFIVGYFWLSMFGKKRFVQPYSADMEDEVSQEDLDKYGWGDEDDD